jgi:hypothetical protein
MSGPLRPCGNARCLLCNPRPAPEPPSDTLPELLLGLAFIVLALLFAFVLLPVMA